MRWYSHLYVGEKAGKRRFSIIQGIREGKLQPEVYVIRSPQNGENLCDIYPSVMLLTPAEKKKERGYGDSGNCSYLLGSPGGSAADG